MADIADKAAETEAHYHRIALQNRKPAGPQATGWCLECGEFLGPNERWCDAQCRDDWEKRNG